MNERNDIDHPIWRKKVDASFLNNLVTPIPQWLWHTWEIEKLFGNVASKKNPESLVSLTFNKVIYTGHVVTSTQNSGRQLVRLSICLKLKNLLREQFLMSYMRSLEGQLSRNLGYSGDIELDIPFWEFIDIEFNSSIKTFHLTAHYQQKATFPLVFQKLVSSPAIKKVDDELELKSDHRIHKQDWKPRQDYRSEIGAENVIYTLIDTENKLIYIGEAKKLISRFDNGHPDISNWDHYKYNVLPESLRSHRLALERMAIRDLAALLENKQSVDCMNISSYKLANRKIDK